MRQGEEQAGQPLPSRFRRKRTYHLSLISRIRQQSTCPLSFLESAVTEDRLGSWSRENADALRRRRIAFSSVRCSSFSREAPPLHARRCSGAEISKSPRFLRFWCPGHVLAFMLLCVEPRVIWGLVGIGF